MRRIAMIATVAVCVPLTLAAATVTHAPWGKDSTGVPVDLYTLTSAQAEVKVATYGARIISVRVPNRSGEVGNVIVGRDALEGYEDGLGPVMGATIGRYANRIAGGEFTLNGITYEIPKNNNGNALHGGTVGFNRKVWKAREVRDGVEMTLISPDGDMGFPGTLTVHVTFTLRSFHGNPALRIDYSAQTDKTTVVNFTNHAFFNLADDTAASVMNDFVRIEADAYTPTDAKGIPTGAIEPVAETPFDFRTIHAIGDRAPVRGYDNNFVLRSNRGGRAAAEVEDRRSGRTLQVFTTEPGLQFFVPRSFAPPPGADGVRPAPLEAFCLETQHFPDAPNHPQFPSTVLLPGKAYRSTTIYVFGVKGTPGK